MGSAPVGALSLALFALLSMAHVGSPDTFFAGDAGPYPIRVIVRLPGVIPGRAQVTVRVVGTTPHDVRRVSIRAAAWTTSIEGAPPADTAVAVPGDPEIYATEMWFMAPTSYRLFVDIEGTRGSGTAIVPALALATAQRTMTGGLKVVLAGLAVFLFVGLLTIVGCAVRESAVPIGAVPDATRRRRARIAMAVTALLLGAAVWGGQVWWAAEASSYGNFVVYRPFTSVVTTRLDERGQVITLGIRDSRWPERPNPNSRYNALMPDHGKLMHLFLVRTPDMGAFAHLHPVARAPAAQDFDVDVPALPAGRYQVYGDIVHESGYAQTLAATVDLHPEGRNLAAATGDPDDSWFAGDAVPENDAAVFRLPDGSSIVWQRGPGPVVAGAERLLTFAARDSAGTPLSLEPYMGMMGHAMVAHEDGSVFAHLHPGGSISMAALQRFTSRDARTADGASSAGLHDMRAMNGSTLSIPYAFPRPGPYRLWVQMKHDGKVMTAAFRIEVVAR